MSDKPLTDAADRPLAADSIFRRIGEGKGERLHPTPLAKGPWYDATQHGSPMLGLLARAVEQHPSDRPRQVVRLTVDLMRAAPMAPVRCTARTERSGRSVEIVEASLLEADGDREFARARAMRFHVADIPAGGGDEVPSESPPERPVSSDLRRRFGEVEGEPGQGREAFHHALEMRPVAAFETPTMWFRFKVPLVEGEQTTPLQRVAVISDFTYSVPFMRQIASNPRLMRDRSFVAINPDTSLNLHRPAEGEWICLDSRTHYADAGAGTALARIHDERGLIGHASQSILVRGVESRPEWSRPTRS